MNMNEFDTAFNNGELMIGELDISKLGRPGLAQRRVNVDLPQWMIQSLDDEAGRIGVTRQSIIKVWLAERLRQKGQIV
jgi:hypothetical protein